ncbi:hypothetical protein C7U92_26510 [Bradyrhizobium sp. WBOS7]|nr:hypothetical protein [Bradyrhizobium sp. WBOS2]MDD1573264.1 hypothetical protein [Bradyrhizobium sp. WBOS1]MDD1580249.1 hypothetical protein [Bradyrhizobium sp. WBOS7]MDD1603455.1 hypothetical protein [Bradyrhizobium sp. WBOS16]
MTIASRSLTSVYDHHARSCSVAWSRPPTCHELNWLQQSTDFFMANAGIKDFTPASKYFGPASTQCHDLDITSLRGCSRRTPFVRRAPISCTLLSYPACVAPAAEHTVPSARSTALPHSVVQIAMACQAQVGYANLTISVRASGMQEKLRRLRQTTR